jgi:hypothetical protein
LIYVIVAARCKEGPEFRSRQRDGATEHITGPMPRASAKSG